MTVGGPGRLRRSTDSSLTVGNVSVNGGQVGETWRAAEGCHRLTAPVVADTSELNCRVEREKNPEDSASVDESTVIRAIRNRVHLLARSLTRERRRPWNKTACAVFENVEVDFD